MKLDTALATVRSLFDAAVARVEPAAAVRRSLRVDGDHILVGPERIDVTPASGGRLFVVAAGKAAEPMAAAAVSILGHRVVGGVAIAKYASGLETGPVVLHTGGHPVPDERGVTATRALYELLRQSRAGDLVVLLLSGGGSALLTMPADGLCLADLRETTGALLGAGADITELNTVRKHLEVLKGGGLAVATPARIAALIVSDVLGDRLDVVASGPVVGDATTFADARAIVERRGLLQSLPPRVVARLESGIRGVVAETPKPGDRRLARVSTHVIANLPLAVAGAAERARQLGYAVELMDLHAEGEARAVGTALGRRARDLAGAGASRRCLIGGGETTVTVVGDGVGGRNTELALAAALELDAVEGVAVASLATDGDDGASHSAGAVVTAGTLARAKQLGLDPVDSLRHNDSATLLAAVGSLLVTGATGTNVADLHVILVGDGGGAGASG